MKKGAIFAGSFDPPTLGHLYIIDKALRIFDYLYVVIAINPDKEYLFSSEERFELLSEMVLNRENVKVFQHKGLIVDFAKSHSIDFLVRGIRNMQDYLYEKEMADINFQLNSAIDTVFIPAGKAVSDINSSSVKELFKNGNDVKKYLSENVYEKLCSKLNIIQNNVKS